MKSYKVTYALNGRSGYMLKVDASNSSEARKLARSQAEAMHQDSKVKILSAVEDKNR